MAGGPVRRDEFNRAGQQAYARADAQFGSGQSGSSRNPGMLTSPISWVRNGRAPSLWVLARLQFMLACISLVAGLAAGGLGATFTLGVFNENGVFSAFQMIVGALTFSVSAAVFLLGAGVTAYLAARNDREAAADAFPVPDAPRVDA